MKPSVGRGPRGANFSRSLGFTSVTGIKNTRKPPNGGGSTWKVASTPVLIWDKSALFPALCGAPGTGDAQRGSIKVPQVLFRSYTVEHKTPEDVRWLQSLTFDLQADLVFSFTQEVVGHARVRALVFCPGSFNLQGAVVVDTVMPPIHATALSVLKPAETGNYTGGLLKWCTPVHTGVKPVCYGCLHCGKADFGSQGLFL